MLDFSADWCVSCKEMEHDAYMDPGVGGLANTVLLQADVTANDAQDQALLKHFGIYGPPSIMFFEPAARNSQTCAWSAIWMRVISRRVSTRFSKSLELSIETRTGDRTCYRHSDRGRCRRLRCL